MTQKNIKDRLHDVFMETFNDQNFPLELTLQKGDIDSWDSFAHINLMLGIEGEFGVEFDSDEIATLLSIGQILEALQKRVRAANES